MRKLHPFAPPLHYNECPRIFSLRFAYVKIVSSSKKTPELAGVLLTQYPISKEKLLADVKSTVHWAINSTPD